MRLGQNPAKSVNFVAQPAEITVAVVVYIPFLEGYYSEGLRVLDLCLDSIWKNTHIPHDLMVFDNGSCPEVRDFLTSCQQEGKIQYLTFSEKNIGKVGAWNYIFGAAPGKYVAYADSDVFHFPGWLAPQIEVLELLPNAGMITGMPLLAAEELSSATVEWAQTNSEATWERGHFISWEDFFRHSGTLGRSQDEIRQYYDQNPIVRIGVAGKQFYASASHFQFISRKETLQKIFPLSADRPMGQVRQLDEAINRLGYLRLSTPEWYVQHIGNTLPKNQASQELEVFFQFPSKESTAKERKSIWDLKILQKILRWIYDRIFEILYKN
jgi:glycosyltransferase involved in cell wall biosynthesis